MSFAKLKSLLGLILLSSVGLAASAPGAFADTYMYSGYNYTSCYGPSYAPSCWNYGVTGSFTTPTALGANLSNQVIDPTSFSFSDGSMTLTQSNTVTSYIEVSTDGAGNIVNWSVNATLYSIYYAAGYEYGAYETIYSIPTGDSSVQNDYYTFEVLTFFPNPVYCDATQTYTYQCGETTYQGSSLSAASNSVSGSWIDEPGDPISTAGSPAAPTPTPEPSTCLLLGMGLFALAAWPLAAGCRKLLTELE